MRTKGKLSKSDYSNKALYQLFKGDIVKFVNSGMSFEDALKKELRTGAFHTRGEVVSDYAQGIIDNNDELKEDIQFMLGYKRTQDIWHAVPIYVGKIEIGGEMYSQFKFIQRGTGKELHLFMYVNRQSPKETLNDVFISSSDYSKHPDWDRPIKNPINKEIGD